MYPNTLAQYLTDKVNGLLTRKGLVEGHPNPHADPQGSDAAHFLPKCRQEQGSFFWGKHLQRMRVESEHHACAPYLTRAHHRLAENCLVPEMHPVKVAKSQHGLLVRDGFQPGKILYKLHSTLHLS
jgi:hypothetical protein